MLDKTNYTTRTDLEPEEIAVLVRVRTALETGEISARRFEMDTIWRTNQANNKCGSVGCIGGWAAHYLKLDPCERDLWMAGATPVSSLRRKEEEYKLIDERTGMYNLFFPASWTGAYHAKPKHAVQAINNFLMGSDDPWTGVKGIWADL